MATKTEPAAPLNVATTIRQAYADFNANRGKQAEIGARKVLQADPDQPDALHLLGLIAHAVNKPDDAIALIAKACRKPGAPALFHSNLAEMLRRRGRLGEAEISARNALRIDQKHGSAWNNLGIILQETGKLEQSRHCLQTALELNPDSAELHNNLGNTLKRLGQSDAAQSHWQRALQLKPDYAEVLSNMAVMFTEQMRFEEAIEYGKKALALNPRLIDAYVNIAGAENARQRFDAAFAWLDKGLRTVPGHPGALAAMAAALKHKDKMAEAENLVRKGLELHPQNAELYCTLGVILQANGDIDGAMQAYDMALKLPGMMGERAMVNKGVLLMEHGQSEAARIAFDAALAAYPRSASAWFNSADLNKFKDGDARVTAMEALLASGVSPSEDMLLNFALGKAWLDIGDSDKAFSHLNRANDAKRASITYNSKSVGEWMGKFPAIFTPELSKMFAGAGDPSKMPVFIVGMPRSGTTLVEQILASHPDIFGAGELKTLQQGVDSIPGYPGGIGALTPQNITELGQRYVAAVTTLGQGKKHVVDKMPANFLHLSYIRMAMPNARIIHVRRDPVDTCLSCYSKHFASEQFFTYNLTDLGEFYSAYTSLMDHWRGQLPADRFIEVNYEDVVDDIEGQARRMLDFIGVPFDPACVAFHQTKRPVRTASVNQVRQPVYATSKGRWKKHEKNLSALIAALPAR